MMAKTEVSVGIEKDRITININDTVFIMSPDGARWLAAMLALRADQLDPPSGDDDTDDDEEPE